MLRSLCRPHLGEGWGHGDDSLENTNFTGTLIWGKVSVPFGPRCVLQGVLPRRSGRLAPAAPSTLQPALPGCRRAEGHSRVRQWWWLVEQMQFVRRLHGGLQQGGEFVKRLAPCGRGSHPGQSWEIPPKAKGQRHAHHNVDEGASRQLGPPKHFLKWLGRRPGQPQTPGDQDCPH